MITIEAGNTFAVRLDENGNPIEGLYMDEGTSMITNDSHIKVNDLTTEQVDWVLNHASENGITGELLIVENQPRSAVSDEAVNKLVNEGKTIITVAP